MPPTQRGRSTTFLKFWEERIDSVAVPRHDFNLSDLLK